MMADVFKSSSLLPLPLPFLSNRGVSEHRRMPLYDTQKVSVPLGLFVGEADTLIDIPRLLRLVPTHSRPVPPPPRPPLQRENEGERSGRRRHSRAGDLHVADQLCAGKEGSGSSTTESAGHAHRPSFMLAPGTGLTRGGVTRRLDELAVEQRATSAAASRQPALRVSDNHMTGPAVNGRRRGFYRHERHASLPVLLAERLYDAVGGYADENGGCSSAAGRRPVGSMTTQHNSASQTRDATSPNCLATTRGASSMQHRDSGDSHPAVTPSLLPSPAPVASPVPAPASAAQPPALPHLYRDGGTGSQPSGGGLPLTGAGTAAATTSVGGALRAPPWAAMRRVATAEDDGGAAAVPVQRFVFREPRYEHLDFLWASTVKDRAFPAVEALLDRFRHTQRRELPPNQHPDTATLIRAVMDGRRLLGESGINVGPAPAASTGIGAGNPRRRFASDSGAPTSAAARSFGPRLDADTGPTLRDPLCELSSAVAGWAPSLTTVPPSPLSGAAESVSSASVVVHDTPTSRG
jgi:hypothetical protein